MIDEGFNQTLIDVLKKALWQEREKIKKAEMEIIKLQLDLLGLGVELSEGGE